MAQLDTPIVPSTVSVPTAAAILGVGRNTAYTAVRLGHIPSIRVGRRIVVPYRPLMDLVEGKTAQAAAA